MKRRNLPSEVAETPSTTLACPMEEQWQQMLALQAQTVKMLGQIVEQVEDYPTPPDLYPHNAVLRMWYGSINGETVCFIPKIKLQYAAKRARNLDSRPFLHEYALFLFVFFTS